MRFADSSGKCYSKILNSLIAYGGILTCPCQFLLHLILKMRTGVILLSMLLSITKEFWTLFVENTEKSPTGCEYFRIYRLFSVLSFKILNFAENLNF